MLQWNLAIALALLFASASSTVAAPREDHVASYFDLGGVIPTLAEASPSDMFEPEQEYRPARAVDVPFEPWTPDGCATAVADRNLAGVKNPAGGRLDFGGWTQLGYHSRTVPLSRERDDLGSFHDQPHRLNLHQQWLWVERTAAPTCCGWDWGFRADVVYGIDAQKTQALGNPGGDERGRGRFDASLDHGAYGWAIPQLYGEVAVGDWSLIAGHFFTLGGYETVAAPENFFYSHSYAMFNSEPFTHTGVLATYRGIDGAEVYMGWTLGWDTGFDQLAGGSAWLGGFRTQLSENVAFTYISTYGNFGWRDQGGDNSYQQSVVLDVAITSRLNYVLQSDWLDADVPSAPLNDTVGINQYLFYEIDRQWAAGSRVEWWKGDGTSFYGVTYGLNYRPAPNVVLRPEVRHDWSPGADAGGDFRQTAFGVDLILSY